MIDSFETWFRSTVCRDKCKRCSFPGISCCSNRKKSCWPAQMAATGWPHSTHYSSPFLFFYIFHFLKPAKPRQRQPSARDKLTTVSLGNYYIQFGRKKVWKSLSAPWRRFHIQNIRSFLQVWENGKHHLLPLATLLWGRAHCQLLLSFSGLYDQEGCQELCFSGLLAGPSSGWGDTCSTPYSGHSCCSGKQVLRPTGSAPSTLQCISFTFGTFCDAVPAWGRPWTRGWSVVIVVHFSPTTAFLHSLFSWW